MIDFVVVCVKFGSYKGFLVEVGFNGELIIYVCELVIDGKVNDVVIWLFVVYF